MTDPAHDTLDSATLDSPPDFPTTSPSDPTFNFDMMALPQELRILILYHMFRVNGHAEIACILRQDNPHAIIHGRSTCRTHRFWGKRAMTDLLVLNKQLHTEAFHTLYTRFPFLTRMSSSGSPRSIEMFEAVSPAGRALIRSLEVGLVMDGSLENEGNFHATDLENVTAGLKRLGQLLPNVRQVTIYWRREKFRFRHLAETNFEKLKALPLLPFQWEGCVHWRRDTKVDKFEEENEAQGPVMSTRLENKERYKRRRFHRWNIRRNAASLLQTATNQQHSGEQPTTVNANPADMQQVTEPNLVDPAVVSDTTLHATVNNPEAMQDTATS